METATHSRRHTQDGTAGSAFLYAGTELEAMAFAPNYYGAIHGWFNPYLGRRVMEVGAGVGTFSSLLIESPGVEEVMLVEPAANNLPALEARFADKARVRIHGGYLDDLSQPFDPDAIALVNVLEHIEDDRGFALTARRTLKPGGHLLIFVPALPAIFGALDEAFDHYRRYTRRTLSDLLTDAGFDPVKIRYVNFPGAFTWFLTSRVFRRRTLGSGQVRAYDRWVVPAVLNVERRWSPPFGQSLLAIARAI